MKDIVIVGAGGFGKEVAWLIEDINKNEKKWNILGFVDDNLEMQNRKVGDYTVIGNLEWLKDQELNVVFAIGNPIVKRKIVEKLECSKNMYPILIHSSTIISDSVQIGEGSIICAGSIITVDIVIGKHVIINVDSTVGHDAILNDYTTVLPSVNVSGNVNIGKCVSIGTGTAIIQGINVGENSIIGAGSVVIRDIGNDLTVAGVPTKVIN